MILLAQSNWEAPATLGAWLACLFFLLGGINLAAKVWDRFNGKNRERTILPNPVITQNADQWTPLEDFRRHVVKNDEEHKEFRENRQKDADAAGAGRKRIYDKLDELEKAVGEMPGRIVADLLNAKKLFQGDKHD